MGKECAVLFDLDGVIIDTEPQYSVFWDRAGKDYLHDADHFGMKIKGNTLQQIFDLHFAGHEDWQREITAALSEWEQNMHFDLIPGILDFLEKLQAHCIPTALVTSSDDSKLGHLWEAHPSLQQFFPTIISADDITRSKPDPEGYLLASQRLEVVPQKSFVFEDSRAGLQAGRAGGMTVIGVATTLPAQEIAPLADYVIHDFVGISPEEILLRKKI
ncbi:MAG: HAD family phosphatase [Porphyromonadaceae bacterium]|nr:HAD family phosphatase [Porphyromonadaceae bacterium]